MPGHHQRQLPHKDKSFFLKAKGIKFIAHFVVFLLAFV